MISLVVTRSSLFSIRRFVHVSRITIYVCVYREAGPGDPAAHRLPAYRCFLPDLAGFAGFCCTGPSPYSHARLSKNSLLTASVCPREYTMAKRSGGNMQRLIWRRGWDSNPRSRCRDACFPSMSIRPLSHLSAPRSTRGGILACVCMASKANGSVDLPQKAPL
jgi:hypothetical protein